MIISDTTISYGLHRSNIPNEPGVYIVYAWAKPIYVGSTLNFRQRLFTHSLKEQFVKLGATHIRLLQCERHETSYSRANIGPLEREWIAKLKPKLNHIPKYMKP